MAVDTIYLRDSTTDTTYYWVSADGTNWSDSIVSTYDVPYYKISSVSLKDTKAHYFEFKGALFCCQQYDDQTYSKLYINGDLGVVKTGGSTTSVIADSGSVTWTADEAINCILVIVSGTGKSQPQNWRVITDNTATSSGETTFTVEAFDVAPAAGDIFAIVASDKWTEITDFDTNWNVRVTDVLSANGSMYFACGDSTAMVRVNAYSNAGAWTYTYSGITASVDAETGQFTYLGQASDQAGNYIWGAKGGYPSTIAYATAADNTGFTGSNETVLTFSSAINVGDLEERITGLEVYGEYGELVVLKEGSIHRIFDKKPYQIGVREMERAKDGRNGKAHCVHGAYLFFSFQNTVFRYYQNNVDRVGPDTAEVGIPTSNRAGHFADLTGYPGLVLGAMDAGEDGVSSVLSYNGQGWCELYRGTAGERIQSIYVQPIPGNAPDRLWISQAETHVWMPMSIDPYNHPSDSYNPYVFATEGILITAWYYLGLQEIDKLFNSIKVVCEDAGTDEQVYVSYQVDDGTTWTDVAGSINQFSEELDLATVPSVTGKRIRFRLRLTSSDGADTPRVLATVLEAITRLPNKYITTLTFRVVDYDTDLTGNKDLYTSADTKLNDLDGMMNLIAPVSVTSMVSQLDGAKAFVDALNMNPYIVSVGNHKRKEGYIGQIRLVEI